MYGNFLINAMKKCKLVTFILVPFSFTLEFCNVTDCLVDCVENNESSQDVVE